MKKYFSLIMFLFFSVIANGQENDKKDFATYSMNPADTIVIADLVQKQILTAKEREAKKTTEAPQQVIVNKAATVKAMASYSTTTVDPIENFITKNFFMIIALSGIVMLAPFVYLLVVRIRKKKDNLRENIKKLRAEEIVVKANPKLKKIRVTLLDQSLLLNRDVKATFEFTKNHTMAKGEVMLAKNIKALQNNYLHQERV